MISPIADAVDLRIVLIGALGHVNGLIIDSLSWDDLEFGCDR